MASASSPASLSGPQIQVESDRVVIKNGALNNKGVSYDITITFQSRGRDVAPPQGLSKVPALAGLVSSLAQRILNSLPEDQYDKEKLEKLAFLVKNTADGENSDTAILVSNAAQPVLDSWKLGRMDAFSRKDNPTDIPLHYDGTEFEGESKLQNVHEGLIELRGLFEAETFVAMPRSAKPKKKTPPPSVESSRPNIGLSFNSSGLPAPGPSGPSTPPPLGPPTPAPSRKDYKSRYRDWMRPEAENDLRKRKLEEERKAQFK